MLRLLRLLLLAVPWSAAFLVAAERPMVSLDEVDPFYPNLHSRPLTTPQWVGEEGVEAVVILAIDDMREAKRYEIFLRPILDRLKKRNGRAPLSIMTCTYTTNDLPQIQSWLTEGVSIEVHTLGHPCPILQGGNFASAESNYFGCLDLLSRIPGVNPVAFRMPCCDSMNSPSPRFYAEIFNRPSPGGGYLHIDSSVMNLTTTNDPVLPRELVIDEQGRERFRKYFPTQTNAVTKLSLGNFSTTIENYPYPYPLGTTGWEFPCAVPSDWESFNLQGPTHAQMLADWKAGLDVAVRKQGTFTMIFHPYGWSTPQQFVELIDYAESRYGGRVKFLNFREALERLQKNFPSGLMGRVEPGRENLPPGIGQSPVFRRDLDQDGVAEVIVSNPSQNQIFKWSEADRSWKPLPYALPQIRLEASGAGNDPGVKAGAGAITVSIVDEAGRDNGLRFVDLNGDGHDDVIFSNEKYFGIWLWVPAENKRLGWTVGWTDEVIAGRRGDAGEIPMIVRGGAHRNNGVWFKDGCLWMQNEDTASLPDKVVRIPFAELLTRAQPKAKSPRDSLEALRVRKGFQAELVASEPLLESPVAFEWSADGRLWVVEMPDYPQGLDGRGKAGGRVRILEDTDGDGIYDKTTLFLDGLNFPTGIMPWRNGIIVGAAPEIFFAEERDGKCISRKTLFSGFREGNPQHRLNGFDYGLDGWIYGANGDSGGEVKSAATGKSVDLRGHDFRFRPDTGEFETVEGQTQYGRHRDDWGNWFGNNNPAWLWHYYFPERFLKRNPFLAVKTSKRMLADYADGTRCFPASRMLQRFNDFFAYNHVTSGNSPTPYRDDLFGPDFAASVFISEPVHNLVHREILSPDGVSFTSHRAADEADSEFLASADNWFRPTMLKTGPDGALYVADMYRLVIEHPEWIPAHIQKQYDLRAGADRGRLYRIYPQGKKPRKIPNLRKLDAEGLAAAMESPNGWQRDTAERLLVERGWDSGVERALNRTLKSAQPKARGQALATLAQFGLNADRIIAASRDADPGVRALAAELSEGVLEKNEILFRREGKWRTDLDATLRRLAGDANEKVRFATALVLGQTRSPAAGKILASSYEQGHGDESMRLAVLSSATPHGPALLEVARRMGDSAAVSILERLATNRVTLVAPVKAVVENDSAAPARRAARQKILEQYAGVARLSGNMRHGAEVFRLNCATCHRFRGEGMAVGPDLGIVAEKPVAEILVAILDPNAAVDPAFVNYVVETGAGEVNGVIVSETATGLTVRNAGGFEQTILQRDIRKLRNTGASLMPEGLENALSPQDMADLIGYIRGR